MIVNDPIYREKVYELVRQIPAGKVMNYGQIAMVLGEGYTARTIGYVMHGADNESVPWHRVINSHGKCSTGRLTIPINLQQELLEADGIEFNASGRCDMSKYQWWPDDFGRTDTDQINLFIR